MWDIVIGFGDRIAKQEKSGALGTTGSNWSKNNCLSIPSGLGTPLEKKIFALGILLDAPSVGPNHSGPGLPSSSTK